MRESEVPKTQRSPARPNQTGLLCHQNKFCVNVLAISTAYFPRGVQSPFPDIISNMKSQFIV